MFCVLVSVHIGVSGRWTKTRPVNHPIGQQGNKRLAIGEIGITIVLILIKCNVKGPPPGRSKRCDVVGPLTRLVNL